MRILPREPAYEDTSIMPFGVHKGKPLQDVPAHYLLWLWDEGKNRDEMMDNYIFNSMSALKEECPDRVVKRRE